MKKQNSNIVIFLISVIVPFFIGVISFASQDYFSKFGLNDVQTSIFPFVLFISSSFIALQIYMHLSERNLESRIQSLVDDNIFPRISELSPLSSSIIDKFDDQYLDRTQKDLKRITHHYLLRRHIYRMSALRNNSWVDIYDFGVVNELLDYLFKARNSRDCVLRDYTVAYNADYAFRNYSFYNYFESLLRRKYKHSFCQTELRILIYVDFDDGQRKDMSSGGRGKDGTPLDAGIHFEECLKLIFEKFRASSNIHSDNLTELYKLASDQTQGNFSFRILTKAQKKWMNESNGATAVQPFNVYDDIAVSRSIVREFDTEEERPVPHVEMSIHTEKRIAYTKLFDEMWDKANLEVDTLFDHNMKINDLGSRAVVRRWVDVKLT